MHIHTYVCGCMIGQSIRDLLKTLRGKQKGL